jgi:hypothetical protein
VNHKKILLLILLSYNLAKAQVLTTDANTETPNRSPQLSITPKFKFGTSESTLFYDKTNNQEKVYVEDLSTSVKFKFSILEQLSFDLNLQFLNSTYRSYFISDGKKKRLGPTQTVKGMGDPVITINFRERLDETLNYIKTGVESNLSDGDTPINSENRKIYPANHKTPYTLYHLGIDIDPEGKHSFGGTFAYKSYNPTAKDSILKNSAEMSLIGTYGLNLDDQLSFQAQISQKYFYTSDLNYYENTPQQTSLELGSTFKLNLQSKLGIKFTDSSVAFKPKYNFGEKYTINQRGIESYLSYTF